MSHPTSYLKDSLSSIVSRWNLLKNPFYVAWTEGRLSRRALQAYAEEYGAFISCLPEGWTTLSDAETTQEEQEHMELWDDFAEALDTKVGQARVPEVQALIDTTKELFSDQNAAPGALYAFEVQQPETARTKLDGLKTKYDLPKGVEPYFEAHLHNEHEAEKLFTRMESLDTDKREKALDACRRMSESLWNALEGLYFAYSA